MSPVPGSSSTISEGLRTVGGSTCVRSVQRLVAGLRGLVPGLCPAVASLGCLLMGLGGLVAVVGDPIPVSPVWPGVSRRAS